MVVPSLRIIFTDRLRRYGRESSIEDVLGMISDRIKRRLPRLGIRLEGSMPDLRREHAGLRRDFHDFFPELLAFAREFHELPLARQR